MDSRGTGEGLHPVWSSGVAFEEVARETKAVISQWEHCKKSPQTWNTKMLHLQESWKESREAIVEAVLCSSKAPSPQDVCSMCHIERVVIRCIECTNKQLCSMCDLKVHSAFPLHDRDAFVNGHYKSIAPTLTVDGEGNLAVVIVSTIVSTTLLGYKHVNDLRIAFALPTAKHCLKLFSQRDVSHLDPLRVTSARARNTWSRQSRTASVLL